MKSISPTTASRVALFLLTALAVTLFFGLCYPHHLHYQEQYQLFLFDWGYACEVLRLPGGLADYLGRFLTQFFLYGWIGATLLGLLIASSQALSARCLTSSRLLCLSALPALLEVRILCDEHALTGILVALLLTQVCAWCIAGIGSQTLRQSWAILLFPLVYWAAGPIAFLYALLVALDEWRRSHTLRTLGWSLVLTIVALALPQFLSQFLPVEPQQLYSGIHYYRTYDADSSPIAWAAASILLMEVATLFSKRKAATPMLLWFQPLSFILLGGVGAWLLVVPHLNFKAEEVMGYDYMARFCQWNRIEQTARQHKPNNPLSMTAVNLSLGMKGRLTEEFSHYPQRGTTGLLPPFTRDMTIPLVTSEVFYQLGMINTAQRLTFEAQEAIYDYQKSGRCYKRLAETSLILGHYDLARKYLSTLCKSLYYRHWAEETLTLLGNEAAIDNHPEYGRLRKLVGKSDCFFNETDLIGMLKNHLTDNPDNPLAQQYLVCTYYLTGKQR